jgi:hypothetical protein
MELEDNLNHERFPVPVKRLFCIVLRDVRIRAFRADGDRESNQATLCSAVRYPGGFREISSRPTGNSEQIACGLPIVLSG